MINSGNCIEAFETLPTAGSVDDDCSEQGLCYSYQNWYFVNYSDLLFVIQSNHADRKSRCEQILNKAK